jgi:hypothetical protein
LDLDIFLHSITYYPPNKDINKHFNIILDDTDDVNFNLSNFLEFNLIKNYFKSHVSLYTNRTSIVDITFKFNVGHDIRLIYDCFYVPRKK